MSGKKWRAVCFINQFFGQIGGEEKAFVGFRVSDKPVGPAMLINSKLGEDCEVVGTVICGDNYFAENIDLAVAEGVKIVKELKPDIFFAGPAFNAGRYGMSCGNMASAVAKQLCIPTVTGMYPENPAVELFRKDTYIMKTEILSSDMRKVAPKMVDIGLRLLKKEHIGSAETEGYIKRDIIKNEYQNRTAAERAIDMVLHKIKGEPFVSELLPPVFDIVEPAPAVLDISKAKLALVTDGGLIPESNPDKLKPNGSTNWGEYNLEELLADKHFVIHSGYDGTWVLENPYRLFAKDVLLELVQEGKLGELNENVFVTCGNCASIEAAKKKGKAIAQRLLQSGVDAAILTSTWGTSTRCGSTITKEIERVGIPVVQICAVYDIAKSIGVSRILRGFAITSPVGNPTLGEADEKESRKRYMEKAIEMLQKPGNPGEVVDVR